jgi:DNA-binding transcriptional MerR regulator/methylmalonyl-CoA mutase cobalamin-binding subunit
VPRKRSQRIESAASGLLSIGALAAATGIPVETIRSWERRYGFPVAERKPSGHRVYHLAAVPRLRRVAQAIAAGHRAAEVLPASEGALDALLASSLRPGAEPPTSSLRLVPLSGDAPAENESELFEAVRIFDAERMRHLLHAEWARLGPMEFLEQQAAPFLAAIGNAWARGTLNIRHEHFASGVLGDFLRTVRLPIESRARGPFVVLATLPGEQHGLGIQMSALVFGLAGWRALVLGVETPAMQIAELTGEVAVGAIALSCVVPRRSNAGAVRTLRRRIPRRIPMLVGGAGAPNSSARSGIERIESLGALDRWLQVRTVT